MGWSPHAAKSSGRLARAETNTISFAAALVDNVDTHANLS
jgi:hypothetical protein